MNRRTRNFLLAGLAVALLLAFGVSRYASSQPDGLAKVAVDENLDTGEREHPLADGPLAGYATTGVDDDGLSTGLAGVVGVAVTFAIAGGAVWVARRRSGEATADRSAHRVGVESS
jgi:PDGLE domain